MGNKERMVQAIKENRREFERRLVDALLGDADSLSNFVSMLNSVDASKQIVNECTYLSFIIERSARNIARWSDEAEGLAELPFPENSW